MQPPKSPTYHMCVCASARALLYESRVMRNKAHINIWTLEYRRQHKKDDCVMVHWRMAQFEVNKRVSGQFSWAFHRSCPMPFRRILIVQFEWYSSSNFVPGTWWKYIEIVPSLSGACVFGAKYWNYIIFQFGIIKMFCSAKKNFLTINFQII